MQEPLRYFALLGIPGHTLIVGRGFEQLVAGNVNANKFGHSPGKFPGKVTSRTKLFCSVQMINVIGAMVPVCLFREIDVALSQMLPFGA